MSGSSSDRWLPPGAALLTLLLAWLGGLQADALPDGVGAMLALVLLPMPFVLAAVWGTAVLTARSFGPLAVAAVVALAGTFLLTAPMSAVSMLGTVGTGLVGGYAVGRGWRPDAAAGALIVLLLPPLIWVAAEVPVDQQMEIMADEVMTVLEQNVPESADEEQRREFLARERERLDTAFVWARKLYAALIAVGLLGQAALVLGILRLIAHWRRLPVPPLGWPPFTRWRLPFYLVWVFVAGLGGLVTRQPVMVEAGLALALVSGLVISVQGLAVQVHQTARLLPPPARVVYWLFMGVFLAPVPVVAGLVLGLADQWWDLRRLDADEEPADGS